MSAKKTPTEDQKKELRNLKQKISRAVEKNAENRGRIKQAVIKAYKGGTDKKAAEIAEEIGSTVYTVRWYRWKLQLGK